MTRIFKKLMSLLALSSFGMLLIILYFRHGDSRSQLISQAIQGINISRNLHYLEPPKVTPPPTYDLDPFPLGESWREMYNKTTTFIPGMKYDPLVLKRNITSLLKRSDHLVVPNIVHFIWFGFRKPMRFHHMLSLFAAYKNTKPDRLLLHCDNLPVGKWWELARKNITMLEIIIIKAPNTIFGKFMTLPEHKADVARIQIIQQYGGIYFDFDVWGLKPLKDLRYYEMTMGIEYHGTPGRLNNGILIANKNARFLKVWLETFKTFEPNSPHWDFHSCVVTYYLQYEVPTLIHVEQRTLNFPNGPDPPLIYRQIYDWSHNYAMHLWYRQQRIEHTPETIKRLNTTFGQMARYIYYGSKELFK